MGIVSRRTHVIPEKIGSHAASSLPATLLTLAASWAPATELFQTFVSLFPETARERGEKDSAATAYVV